jgi:DNA-binding NarL/FixJ family response regulator
VPVRKEGPVVLADGDAGERGLVAATLRRAGFDTIEVGSGFDALEAGRAPGVGLVMLEVALPDMTGYEVCHALRRERGDEIPIVFISATRTDSLDHVVGLLLGADDYMSKPLDPSELVARVGRFVSRAGAHAPESEVANGLRLTKREREVLELLAQGCVQKEIAVELSISPKTVGTHIQQLLIKLGVHSRAEVVARAFRVGLVSPLYDRRASGQTPSRALPAADAARGA